MAILDLRIWTFTKIIIAMIVMYPKNKPTYLVKMCGN